MDAVSGTIRISKVCVDLWEIFSLLKKKRIHAVIDPILERNFVVVQISNKSPTTKFVKFIKL